MYDSEKTFICKIMMAGIVGLTALSASPASAAWCKKVYVKATNQTGQPVKIIDLDYYDYEDGKWRSEPTVNKVIPRGQVWADTRTLESVGGERIKIRIEYRDAFGNKKKAYSKAKTCRNGSAFSVSLRGPKVPPPPIKPPQPIATIKIKQGTYMGHWKDGQRLIEHIRRVSDTSFTVKRRGRGGQPVLYTLVGKDTYQNAGGSRIVVTSYKSFVWMNASGGNRVDYRRAR
jgi:hypothetical protein